MPTTDSVQCLVCSSPALWPFLDLGQTALANRFLALDELSSDEPLFPLRVGMCEECGHIQLFDRVPPHAMFDNYLYISSASVTLQRHFDELSRVLTRRLALGADDLVVDVGCNDGTLLSAFRRNAGGKIRVLGVDPAQNLADAAAPLDIPRRTTLFTPETAASIREEYGPAALITATNTFPHIQDIGGFARGLDRLLMPGGVFVAEMHYLGDLLNQVAFDTVYHEHVSYWSLGTLCRAMERHGMVVTDVEHLPIHHGQMRAYIQRRGEGAVCPAVDSMLEAERAQGLRDKETYCEFARKVARVKHDLRSAVIQMISDGKRVVGYGAPAKGNTLLSYLDLGPGELEYIVDRSPLKQGRYTPGMHIPVVPTTRLISDRPDYTVLLAWNFQDEILEQQSEYRKLGGQFITPLPEVRII